ncbi:imidazolonepropionase [Curtobacterium sp. ISL-83]|uniref:imidazolonepropionase n=1 Tax=Curtobacterium sp. ISL-83 TaxID=2819145 RepID=UPI001BEA1C96|nr:imidazolonepropionase [Curtobacterium sp. ISL-83]MBT2501105.1 imidazolonepropionase [Curtobacterium sp. ISL-83]
MTTELITGIGELTTNDGARRLDAAVVVDTDSGLIAWVGSASEAPAADTRFDAAGRAVLPGWVDSHLHPVFAGERGAEFEARMRGEKYRAGGIASTVAATRAASDAELEESLVRLLHEASAQGSTAFEAKTGYGLDVETERRSAEIAARHVDSVTFLGAHLVPPGMSVRVYLDQVTGPMLAAVLPFVSSIDVFCETGAFDVEQSREVLAAGRAAGLALRVHGNQLGESGGVGLALEMEALSVDHCNHLSSSDIDGLGAGRTVATLLPACDLSTREPFPPARALLDAGATIALASNCNPGTSYTTSIPFCIATAVLQMGLTVEEAIRAATVGGAAALGVPGVTGTIAVGARADLQLLDAPSAAHLAYRPGVPLVRRVWKRGVVVAGGGGGS